VAKTAGRERPELEVKCIDVDPRLSPSRVADLLPAELEAEDDSLEVGYTPDGRSVLELRPAPLAPVGAGNAALPPESVVLVTGGADGVTAAVARKLAGLYRPRLVLVGRSPFPGAEPDETRALATAAELRRWLIAALELYRPTPPAETVVPVRIECRERGWKTLLVDAEIEDGAGNVWLRIEGWKGWTRQSRNFRRQPTRYVLSRVLPLPAAHGVLGQVIASSEVDSEETDLMARFFLHDEEMTRFRRLEVDRASRHLWLLDRIVAKDALRRFLRSEGAEEMLHPAAMLLEDCEHRQLRLVSPVLESAPGLTLVPHRTRPIALAHGDLPGPEVDRIRAWIGANVDDQGQCAAGEGG
jgi:hypothetical protein